MLLVVGERRRVPRRGPSAAAGRDEQKATLIQEGQVGPTSSGLFVSLAMCRAASAPWPVRRVGGPGGRAPDSSSPSGARASNHGQGDSAPQSGPELPRRCVSRSRGGWRSHGRGRPAATAAPIVCTARRSAGMGLPARAWGPGPRRHLAARPLATATPSSPTPAPGAPPRASSTLAAEAPPHGVAVVLTSWVIHRVSCSIGYHRSFNCAIFNNL